MGQVSRPRLVTKPACIIQGNLRRGFDEALTAIKRLFPTVIVSTWKSEVAKLPAGNYEVILSDAPPSGGTGNRYYQRVGMVAGLKAARGLDCTHVLRWRTDLLPTRLDLRDLLQRSSSHVPSGLTSRIVLSAWRNLTVKPDWFSSLPDLFMFSDLAAMERLWSVDGLDLNQPVNFPPEMVQEVGFTFDLAANQLTLGGRTYLLNETFDAHIEFYAWFRSRLQRDLGRKLDHASIALSALSLIDHRKLGICWFKDTPALEFRSIFNAVDFPWWTESNWLSRIPARTMPLGWPLRRPRVLWCAGNWLKLRSEKGFQRRSYIAYQKTLSRPAMTGNGGGGVRPDNSHE